MTTTVPYPVVEQTLNQHFGYDLLLPSTTSDELVQIKMHKIESTIRDYDEVLERLCMIVGVGPGEVTGSGHWTAITGDLVIQCLSQTSPMPALVAPAGRAMRARHEPSPVMALEARSVVDEPTRPDLVHELRRLSGLTWEQLANVLRVSRRTLHNWANGLPMSRNHEERLARTISVLRAIDRGSANQNRALLFDVAPQGETLLDLLRREDYDAVLKMGGATPKLASPEPAAAFAIPGPKPLPPSVLADAREERIHKSPDKPARWVSTSRVTKIERK